MRFAESEFDRAANKERIRLLEHECKALRNRISLLESHLEKIVSIMERLTEAFGMVTEFINNTTKD